MKKQIYEIEILNWEKHNKNQKTTHTHIMLSKRFFDDPKIRMLSNGAKLLFLGLLLRRADVDTMLVRCSHDDALMLAGGRGHVVSMLLDQLQSFQLVKWQKWSPTIQYKTQQDVTGQQFQQKEKTDETKVQEQIQKPKPEDLRKLKEMENQLFVLIGDTGFSRYSKQLNERFKSVDEFQRVLEEIIDSASKVGKFDSNISRRKYVKVALMKEIGAMSESTTSK